MTHRVFAVAVMCAATVTTAAAQQQGQPMLGDLARQVEAERAKPKKPARTYTNADLAVVPVLPPPPPAAPAGAVAGTATGKDVSADGAVKPGEQQATSNAPAEAEAVSEERWRQRASRIRDQVERARGRLEKLVSRPPNPNATLQQRAEQEMAVIREDFVKYRTQWEALEQEAQAAKVSFAWIAPAPRFQ